MKVLNYVTRMCVYICCINICASAHQFICCAAQKSIFAIIVEQRAYNTKSFISILHKYASFNIRHTHTYIYMQMLWKRKVMLQLVEFFVHAKQKQSSNMKKYSIGNNNIFVTCKNVFYKHFMVFIKITHLFISINFYINYKLSSY